MKKVILYSSLPLLAILLFVSAQISQPAAIPVQDEIELDCSDEVMTLLKRACFDCHTKDASNAKAKLTLNFNKWADYKLSKKIGKLNDISEVVKEQKMPPAKYVNKYPEAALNEEDIALVSNWANAQADKLMEEE